MERLGEAWASLPLSATARARGWPAAALASGAMAESTASGELLVDWAGLSDMGAWTLANIEMPLLLDPRSYRDLGLPISTGEIGRRRQALRAELARSAQPAE
jgi:hypothetical protein